MQQSDKTGLHLGVSQLMGCPPKNICILDNTIWKVLLVAKEELLITQATQVGRFYLGGSQGTLPYGQQFILFRMMFSIISVPILLLF